MTSLYFFPIDIVTGVNSKMIMAGFGLVVFMAQLAQRKKDFVPVKKEIPRGFLSKYAKTVKGANVGAITD